MPGERRKGVGCLRCKQRAGRIRLGLADEAREGRTANMLPMSVTLTVAHDEISSLNVGKSRNNPFMFVIDETPQLEMCPYVMLAA